MTDYRLISSDSHVTMPDDAWQEYLDPEFRDRAPRVERTDEGDFRVFEGRRTPIMTLDNLAGKKPEEFTLNVRKLEDQRSGAWDPAERIKDMDIDGVDAEVLYVGGPLHVGRRRAAAEQRARVQPLAVGLRVARARPAPRHGGDPDRHAGARGRGDRASRRRSPASRAATSRCSRPRATTATRSGTRCGRRSARPACPIGLHVGGRRPGTPTVSIYESAPRFMTGLVMSKLTMAESVSELIHGLVMQRYPELKFIVGRGPDRLDLLLPVLLRPPLGEAPLLDQERAGAPAELLLPAPGVRHVHGGPGRAARARAHRHRQHHVGERLSRTPRPRGRTRRRSPTSGSRRSATRRRPRSSGRTAPSSTAWSDGRAPVLDRDRPGRVHGVGRVRRVRGADVRHRRRHEVDRRRPGG